jgi:hypothetical protein
MVFRVLLGLYMRGMESPGPIYKPRTRVDEILEASERKAVRSRYQSTNTRATHTTAHITTYTSV